MTRENWDALLAAMRRAKESGSAVGLSPPENDAILHELEVLGGSGFLTTEPEAPPPLKRAV